MVARSWDGERVEAIAQEVGCSPQTVRRRLHRFDAEGIEGLLSFYNDRVELSVGS